MTIPPFHRTGTAITAVEPLSSSPRGSIDFEPPKSSPTERKDPDLQRFGYLNVPYSPFVDVLAWVSTIGAAISITSMFTLVVASSFLGDESPDAILKVRHMSNLLAWSSGIYATAIIVTVGLQMLYTSPPYSRLFTEAQGFVISQRKVFKTHYWTKKTLVQLGLFLSWAALGMQIGGTMCILEAMAVFAPVPARSAQIGIAIIAAVCGTMWAVVEALEREDVRKRWIILFGWMLPRRKENTVADPEKAVGDVSPPEGGPQ